MAIDSTKAFEVSNGVLVYENAAGNVVDGPFITGGVSTPLGLDLPTNSFYIQVKNNGLLFWRKFSTGNNDWSVHENLNRTESIDYDIHVPIDSSYQLHSRETDCEMFIDGEVYII